MESVEGGKSEIAVQYECKHYKNKKETIAPSQRLQMRQLHLKRQRGATLIGDVFERNTVWTMRSLWNPLDHGLWNCNTNKKRSGIESATDPFAMTRSRDDLRNYYHQKKKSCFNQSVQKEDHKRIASTQGRATLTVQSTSIAFKNASPSNKPSITRLGMIMQYTTDKSLPERNSKRQYIWLTNIVILFLYMD